MIPELKYLILTLRHKYFVFRAGLKVGAPIWRLIKHDWSKLLPSELSSYGQQFFGDKDNSDSLNISWLKHQNRHDHHWEFWIPRTGHGRCVPVHNDNEPFPMEYDAILEMISDWIGASKAYNGEWPTKGNWRWLDKNFKKIRVHEETKKIILEILKRLDLI